MIQAILLIKINGKNFPRNSNHSLSKLLSATMERSSKRFYKISNHETELITDYYYK